MITQNKPIRVLVADDQPVVRRSIRRLLAQCDDMFVAGEAADGDEALEQVLSDGYDLVILDITMPLRNGLDVLKDIKHERPDLPVLILSIHPPDQYEERALRLGAAGYVTKERAPEDLIEEVRKAAQRALERPANDLP